MPVSITIKRAGMALLLGLGLVACDSGESEDDTSTTTAAASESGGGGSGASADPSGGMSEPPSSQQKLKLGDQGQDKQAMMKKRMEMMKKRAKMKKKAFDAAEAAESEGNTPCEKAFHAAIAVDESMRDQLGKKPSGADPSEQKFISTCKSLPDGMQECLVPSYARGNQQECSKTHKGAKPETKAALKKLMTQLRGG